ncbi:MAG: ubiquitin-like protein, partial [Candidatus Fonsibacter sp.]
QVMATDTISTVKALVQNKEDASRSRFHLEFKFKQLKDGSTIADLEITNLSKLDMVLMNDVDYDDDND